MRKILLVFMAILAAAQISAAEYAIVGAFTNPSWNFDASRAANGVLTKNAGGKYETTIENLATGFKIVDIENNNWDVQYGAPSSNDMVENGKTFSLKAKNGVADPSNIEFANYVTAIQNAKVVFDPEAKTLTVTGTPVSNLELYISGNMSGPNWPVPGEDGSIAMTKNGDIYSATVSFTAGNEFKVFGKGWSPEFGVPADNTPALSPENLTLTLAKSTKNIKVSMTGQYVVSFNLSTFELKLTSATGISQTTIKAEAPEYYTLHGVKVASPAHGIYIVKRGTAVTKEIVR
ncbi:MAG: hypothetical protein MRZ50_05965 [Prevotella sp.]|nr:hypothetical protein [Prevotella sp.]